MIREAGSSDSAVRKSRMSLLCVPEADPEGGRKFTVLLLVGGCAEGPTFSLSVSALAEAAGDFVSPVAGAFGSVTSTQEWAPEVGAAGSGVG